MAWAVWASFLSTVALMACMYVPMALAAKQAARSRLRPDPDVPTLHRIRNVPGFSAPLPSEHYSGYLTVDEAAGRELFYYFVTSERDPRSDPLVLWLNGGPGCSSFDGFVYEHGPFTFSAARGTPGVKLARNPYTWCRVANIIYLDSPAGVGLSYSRTRADYVVNDTRTAADANVFLRNWLSHYPEFANHDFYIAGESYAGIYVPVLTREVVRGNDAGQQPRINIKGYMVGNGCTDDEYDGNAIPPFAVGKSLISHLLYSKLQAACAGSYWNATPGGECEQLLYAVQRELSPLNIYDVLADCYHEDAPQLERGAAHALYTARCAAQNGPGGWPLCGALRSGAKVPSPSHLLGFAPPCTDTRVARTWLNNPRVRDALHAKPVSAIGEWTLCTGAITYTHDAGSMVPIHRHLTQEVGLRALVYSGDHDLAVPHTGSEAWTRGLGLQVVMPWRPWLVEDGQVAGYAVKYSNLTYATVKGAGHMVPQTNPLQAYHLFTRFLFDLDP